MRFRETKHPKSGSSPRQQRKRPEASGEADENRTTIDALITEVLPGLASATRAGDARPGYFPHCKDGAIHRQPSAAVQYHLRNQELQGGCFAAAAEQTYDWSFALPGDDEAGRHGGTFQLWNLRNSREETLGLVPCGGGP